MMTLKREVKFAKFSSEGGGAIWLMTQNGAPKVKLTFFPALINKPVVPRKTVMDR